MRLARKQTIGHIVVTFCVFGALGVMAADDYPYRQEAPNQSDPWAFLTRNCTSFVTWRFNQRGIAFSNNMTGPNGQSGRWSDASNWRQHAIEIGFRVDVSPAPGAVAWWPANHVGYVASVENNGTITTEEYNWPKDGAFDYLYHTRSIAPGSASYPAAFIHIRDLLDSSLAATPVPILNGGSLGVTTITWNTGDGGAGQVFVAMDGGAEVLFAQGASGSQLAPWIQAGVTYNFSLYAGTSRSTRLQSVVVRSGVSLVATPNPVPTGRRTGTTTIGWSTGDGQPGQVFVTVNGGGEALFAQGASGSEMASWIQAGTTYELRLYAGTSRRSLLQSVIVQSSVFLEAIPNPMPASSGVGAATISWNTGSAQTGQVFVAINGGIETLFAEGANGSQVASWIQPGMTYEFRLYAGTSQSRLLQSLTVRSAEQRRRI